MPEKSHRLELPQNEETAFEIIHDESTNRVVLSNAEDRFSLDQLVDELQAHEGFKLHIKVTR